MDIDIRTQQITNLTENLVNRDKAVSLIDNSYGLTITNTGTGYTITDVTGGNQDVTTLREALVTAADFIENVVEDDAEFATEWREARQFLTSGL